jgi:hypothetical protein
MNGNTSAQIDHSLKATFFFCSPEVISKRTRRWEGEVYVFGAKPRKPSAGYTVVKHNFSPDSK